MTHNMGTTDRSLRSVVGGAALAAALSTEGVARLGLLGAGALMLGTASTGYCPAYVPLNVDTRETKRQS